MKFTSVFLGIAFLLITLFPRPSDTMAAPDSPLLLLTPLVTQEETSQNQLQANQQTSEPYIARTGEVLFQATDLLPSAAAPPENQATRADDGGGQPLLNGKTVHVVLFADKEIFIEIDRESIATGNTINVSGRSPGASLSTFTMTISEQSYLISFKDLETGLHYRVVGDAQSGRGKVTELDFRKMPPIIDAEPLVPPQE